MEGVMPSFIRKFTGNRPMYSIKDKTIVATLASTKETHLTKAFSADFDVMCNIKSLLNANRLNDAIQALEEHSFCGSLSFKGIDFNKPVHLHDLFSAIPTDEVIILDGKDRTFDLSIIQEYQKIGVVSSAIPVVQQMGDIKYLRDIVRYERQAFYNIKLSITVDKQSYYLSRMLESLVEQQVILFNRVINYIADSSKRTTTLERCLGIAFNKDIPNVKIDTAIAANEKFSQLLYRVTQSIQTWLAADDGVKFVVPSIEFDVDHLPVYDLRSIYETFYLGWDILENTYDQVLYRELKTIADYVTSQQQIVMGAIEHYRPGFVKVVCQATKTSCKFDGMALHCMSFSMV